MIKSTTKITMMHIAAIAPFGSFCFLGGWVGTTTEKRVYETEFTAQNMKFSIKDFFSKCGQICSLLVTFTEKILNGKLHFLCSD